MRSLLVIGCALLTGCTTTSIVPTPQPRASASIAEAMGGGLIRQVGELDGRNRRRALEAEYTALESTPAGRAVTWKSDSGRWAGEVVPAQPYRVGSQDCRQYIHRVSDGPALHEVRGTACRNADGSWTILT